MSRVICVLALVCVSASAQLPKPGGGGSGGGGGGGGGAVDSVFGRVGTVSATSGDYAIDQITNGASIATQNAFAAGATQTFVADGTNSGVQIQCTPLPSTPVAGSIVCDSADGNTLKFWTGTNYIRAGTFGVQDEGVALPSVSTINFTGAGIACTSDPGNNRSNCAVSGSGGGTGLNSLTATQPLISGGTLTDPTLGFGYAFVSTINTPTYTIQASDVGHIKRVSSANRVDITINLMTYPFTFYIFNDNVGPVVITASAGDINGDATLTLLNQEGAFFSLNQTAAFWRGINTSGRVQSGASVPSAARCDEVSEAGQIFVRNAAAATNASLYVCANTAASTYAWEGPFNVTGGGGGGASSFSQLSDFKAVETSATTLTITPGLLATGNFAHPATIGGAVTFSGATSGIAHIFLDDTGQLITEATTGIGMADTGQMTHRSATTPVIPETAVPLCSVTVASGGVYTVTNCTQGTRLRNASVRASTGLLKSVTNGINTLSVDPAVVCLTSGNCGTGGAGATTGAGLPSAALCDAADEVGSGYSDTNVGGDDYKCRTIAASTYLWEPLGSPSSTTTLRFRDDFTAGLITSGNLSDVNLQIAQTGAGVVAPIASVANHIGLRRYTSGTVLDNHGAFVLNTGGGNLLPNLTTFTGWYAKFIFRTDPTAVTNAVYCAGWCGGGGVLTTTHMAALVYDTALSHTTWHFRTAMSNVATGTDTNTGVSVAANTWYNAAIWSVTAGTICYSLNGGAATCHSANLPSTAQSISILSGTRLAGSAYVFDADLMEFTMSGLAR